MSRHDKQGAEPNPSGKRPSTPAPSSSPVAREKSGSVRKVKALGLGVDPGYLATPDHLVLECRRYPDVVEWCDVLHRVVERARTLVELSHRYEGQDSTAKKKTGTKVIRCCRLIVEDVKRIRSLDGGLLLSAQARSKGRRSSLGGLCGLDAAVHIGAWLVTAFADLAVSARPKPIRWTSRSSTPSVDFELLGARQQSIPKWVVTSVSTDMLDRVHSALRSDLAWMCRQHARRAGATGLDVSNHTPSTTHAPEDYDQARARLFASTDPDIQHALKHVFSSERHIKEQYCAVLEAMSETGLMTQKLIAQRLTTSGVPVTPTQVGHRLRAMATFKAVCGERQYRRGTLGTLLMKNCPDRS